MIHAVAGLVHGVQAIALTAIVVSEPEGKWPIVSQGYEKQVRRWEYQLSYALPLFPALSSLNHVVSACSQRYRDYTSASETNPIRWAEYSVSAGVMLWIICTLSGIVEIRTLVSIMLLNALLQHTGFLIEKEKARGGDARELLKVGFAIHCTMWIQIFISFFTCVKDGEAPPGVYSIIIVMFLLFTSFGILSALWVYDKITSYQHLETGYLILSIVSKSFLTWMTLFGVLRPTEEEKQNSVETP
jgi:hypothetical protein